MNKPNAPGEGSELPALTGILKDCQRVIEMAIDSEHHVRPLAEGEELLERIKAALSSPQQESAEFRWISCEQELPSIGQTVIVQGGIAYRVEDEWISQTGGASGRPIMWPVTHWAKIPDIPAPSVTAEGKDRG